MILIPALLTFLNLLAGTASLLMGSWGHFTEAYWLIFLAAGFDGLDGYTARRFEVETQWGAIFDSIADFVSFCIAPAWLLSRDFHFVQINTGAFVFLVWMIAGGFRLIRFHQRLKCGEEQKLFFYGLPTTAAAALIALFALGLRKEAFGGSLILLASLILSGLMISSLRISKPRLDIDRKINSLLKFK